MTFMSKRLVYALMLGSVASAADLRIGIIGTDTSHVPIFTKAFNDSAAPDHIAGFRVVAAYKGGSQDLESSRTRVDQFAEEIRTKYGVEIVPDIKTLLTKVDVVLLESVDGRAHLQQAKQVIAAHKPVFIDKPLASTLDDAREIARLAKAAGVPWFSTSSLRYGAAVTEMQFKDATGAITWGPGPLEEHHQLDLSWYAVHPIEMLFSILGPGCEVVTRTAGKDLDDITCKWKDGRIGSVRAIRPYSEYGSVVFRPKSIEQSGTKPNGKANYVALLQEVAKFFQTGKPPVPNDVTLEIFAFMDAAQRSKEAGGQPMKLRPLW